MTDQLENLLHSETDGEYDSTGEFTIGVHRALEKLSTHQLSEPGLWIVKLVQAGVAYGCDKVDISLGRRLIRVAFYGSTLPTADQALDSLWKNTAAECRGAHHLRVGLRAAIARGTLVLNDLNGQQITLRDSGIEKKTKKMRFNRRSFWVDLQLKNVSWLAALNGHFKEHLQIYKRCSFCPIPVYLDSRLVSGQNLIPPTENGNTRCLAAYLVEPGASSMTLAHRRTKSGQVYLNPSHHWKLVLRGWKTVEVGAVVALVYGGIPRSEVRWLRDGATTDTRALEFIHKWLSIQILLPGDDVEVDLSEFKVRNHLIDWAPVFSALDQMMVEFFNNQLLLASKRPREPLSISQIAYTGSLAGDLPSPDYELSRLGQEIDRLKTKLLFSKGESEKYPEE